MRFRITTDYTIKILIFMASNPGKWTAEDLSAKIDIPKPMVIKVMQSLKARGWVASFEGSLGGYTLRSDPKQITLLQIFDVMDDLIYFDDRKFRGSGLDICVETLYSSIQQTMESTLGSVTVAEMLKYQTEKSVPVCALPPA